LVRIAFFSSTLQTHAVHIPRVNPSAVATPLGRDDDARGIAKVNGRRAARAVREKHAAPVVDRVKAEEIANEQLKHEPAPWRIHVLK
jgi:hypothetical protein